MTNVIYILDNFTRSEYTTIEGTSICDGILPSFTSACKVRRMGVPSVFFGRETIKEIPIILFLDIRLA